MIPAHNEVDNIPLLSTEQHDGLAHIEERAEVTACMAPAAATRSGLTGTPSGR